MSLKNIAPSLVENGIHPNVASLVRGFITSNIPSMDVTNLHVSEDKTTITINLLRSDNVEFVSVYTLRQISEGLIRHVVTLKGGDINTTFSTVTSGNLVVGKTTKVDDVVVIPDVTPETEVVAPTVEDVIVVEPTVEPTVEVVEQEQAVESTVEPVEAVEHEPVVVAPEVEEPKASKKKKKK